MSADDGDTTYSAPLPVRLNVAAAAPPPPPPQPLSPAGITIFAPNLLECKLAVCREKAQRFERMCFAAMEMMDADVPLLYDVLNHSGCDITELDVSFNRLTDAGLHTLCHALAEHGLMAHQLQQLRVGGNDLSAEALGEASMLLAKRRPDVQLVDEARLVGDEAGVAKPAVALMHVGKVFEESPAHQAGLQKGDVVLTFGALSYNGRRRNAGFKSEQERRMDILQHFESVEVSLKPLVAGAVDAHGANKKAIDVVVAVPSGAVGVAVAVFATVVTAGPLIAALMSAAVALTTMVLVPAVAAASSISGSVMDAAVSDFTSGLSLLCVRNHPAAAPPSPIAATAMNSERIPWALRAPEEIGEWERGDWLGRVILDLVCKRCERERGVQCRASV